MGLFILWRKMSLAWQKHLSISEESSERKHRQQRKGKDFKDLEFLKEVSPASMKSWICGLTFSCLDCTNEVQEGPQIG